MSVPLTDPGPGPDGGDAGRADAEPDADRARPGAQTDRRAADTTDAGSRHTVIAPGVVATVAGVAARGVRGVHTLRAPVDAGGALGRVRGALPGGGGDAPSDGVQVEVGEVQAAVDLGLVAEYGVPVARLAGDVRERVIDDVERLTGFEVTEVNVVVLDVHLDEEDET